MKTINAYVSSFALALALTLVGPTAVSAQEGTGERANELAQTCQAESELSPLSVGQCLSLTRENSINELSAACTLFNQQGLIPAVFEDDDGNIVELRNVGDCIAYLRVLE